MACHVPATFAVESFRRRPKLQHFTRNHDAALRWKLRQGTDHAVERLWIGIVAIVDDGCAREAQHLSSFVTRRQRGQRFGGFGQRNSVLQAHRDCRERVIDVVLAQQGQRRVRLFAVAREVEFRTQGTATLDVPGRYIRRLAHSEGHDLAVEVAPELRDELVVGVQDGNPAGGKRLNQFVLGARDCGDGIEELEMDRRDHGHHAAVGLGQPGQLRDFTRVRHTHFDDGDFVLRFELEQLQRHSETGC